MEYLKGLNGQMIPHIGFGTADLVGSVEELVFSAVSAGHRLVDTAQVYGSEKGVGAALKRAIEEGFVLRSELFIETKLAPESHGYYETLNSFEQSLNQLQLDYLDMYLIHWPVARGNEETYKEKNIATWKAFVDLKQKGKVKYIGVCNFLERHLLHLIDACEYVPEVNQLELHPGFQQRGLVRFCREKGMLIEAWSPMGRGVLRKPEFETMAASYGKDTSQLALRWSVQNGYIPLSRSSNYEHITTNMEIFDFEICHEDMEKLNALNTDYDHQDLWSYKRQLMY